MNEGLGMTMNEGLGMTMNEGLGMTMNEGLGMIGKELEITKSYIISIHITGINVNNPQVIFLDSVSSVQASILYFGQV